MRKYIFNLLLYSGSLMFTFSVCANNASGQDTLKIGTGTPSVDKIFTVSCVPCHTEKGRKMSRSKLDFSEWKQYSPQKQKERAEKINSELSKGAMPPKKFREENPGLIPTPEQVDTIKAWSESFSAKE